MSSEIVRLLFVVGKSIALFALALGGFRLMGKRCLGDMEPLDFVLVLVVAEIVGAPLADPELSVLPAVVAVVTLTLVQVGLARLSVAYPTAQRLLEGQPVVVIREGHVLTDNLRRAKVSPAELAERLRERGFSGPADVELAVFETDGMLSALPKREAAPITPRFVRRKASTLLVLRGQVCLQGLSRAKMTKNRLERTLRQRGLTLADLEEAFLDPQGRLQVTLSLTPDQIRAGRSSKSKGTADQSGERDG